MKQTLGIILLTFLLGIAGCGGGGSSTGTVSQASRTTISGVVAKGIFTSGVVDCYLVSGGNNFHLASANIRSNGTYTLDIGEYTGIVLLQVSTGNYNDEVSGSVLALTTPLRAVAVITRTGVARTVSITPLTELATRKAYSLSNPLSITNVNAANALLSDIFPFDILSTTPLPLYALGAGTAEQKCYSFVLAGIAQYGIGSFLTDFNHDLTTPPYRITTGVYNDFTTSMQAFLALGAPYNPTGYTLTSQIPKFDSVGWYTTTVTVSTDNTGSGYNTANVLQFSLLLNPAVYSIDTDPDHANIPDPDVVAAVNPDPTMLAPAITSDTVTGWTVLNVALTYLNGIAPGPTATIRVKTKPGSAPGLLDVTAHHIFQNNLETAVPFASLTDTTDAEWTVSLTY